MAGMIEDAGTEIIICGGSGPTMILGGKKRNNSATMEQVLYHLDLVVPAVKRAHLVAGLPYGSYQVSNEQAVTNAVEMIRHGADSVKLQGAGIVLERIKAIVGAGINVTGHVGLTPQHIASIGSYRSIGKNSNEAIKVYREALALQEAGAWLVELECIPDRVAEVVSRKLQIPTYGIGSGSGCDGQALMTHDILGMQRSLKTRFVKQYVDVWDISVTALKQYHDEVQKGVFPAQEHTFMIDDAEFNQFSELTENISP
jgi:3-methyl-2-oxobutanoate hydroxymethyltransferase